MILFEEGKYTFYLFGKVQKAKKMHLSIVRGAYIYHLHHTKFQMRFTVLKNHGGVIK